jgi:predicted amidohydrolase
MQALMTYCGQLDSYEKSSEVLKEMLQIEVSETQIYRVSDYYGKAVEATVNEDVVLSPVKEEEVLYAEVDGSMILTRERGWSEVKAGRILKAATVFMPKGSRAG